MKVIEYLQGKITGEDLEDALYFVSSYFEKENMREGFVSFLLGVFKLFAF